MIDRTSPSRRWGVGGLSWGVEGFLIGEGVASFGLVAVVTVRLAWGCSGCVDNGGVVLVMVSGI